MVRWKFIQCFNGERPTIELEIYNVLLEQLKKEFIIDTGFDGSILVDNETYKFFKTGEVPEEYWYRYKTLNGVIIMRTAKAFVKLFNDMVEVDVITPRDFGGKNLVGLKLLNMLRLFIDGVKKTTCIVEPE